MASFVAQGLLAAAVVTLAARSSWKLLFVAPLDLAVFREALVTAVAGGQLALGRALCEACYPAFAARHALAGIDAMERGAPLVPALDESRMELEQRLAQGLPALRGLARMASPLAFITIILELGHAGSDRSLRALSRGLPLRVALDHALDALVLGVSTFIVAAAALSILRRAARSLQHALWSLSPALVAAAGDASAFTPPRTAV
jgi:hypothetical protein